jgi:two-component system CheB/CheR fusion protein
MADTLAQAEHSPPADQHTRPARLVVIGSSAGGIEALSAVVARLPADFPAPIVIAQHLDPTRPSQLQGILARYSTLPVRLVDRRAALEAGQVYVVPANRDVEIIDDWMSLKPGAAGAKPSVDLLFSSAAAVFGQRLVAVVLSGTGSDGAVGARAVHEAGGTVIIQNPETAAFPGMPRSLAPAIIDVVAELDELGPLLQSILTGVYVARLPEEERELRNLLDEVRAHRGIDFSRYQRPTVLRRLQRRLTATHQASVADYRRYLAAHPEEEERLIGSLLINVTDFFRDPPAFSYLSDHILPTLLESARQRGGDLRLWSAGCATGEEAYSLAILLHDVLDQQERDRVSARIFATDVDSDAIAFARRGVYPARSLVNLPPDLLRRAFTESDGEYEVIKPVRDLVIFGEHDLGRAAPFRQTDLVLCRNVLMYFTPELQKRALQAFAFSLRDSGYLVLGNAETTRPVGEYFSTDQPHFRVYRRNGKRAALLGFDTSVRVPPAVVAGSPALATADREALTAAAPKNVEQQPASEDLLQRLPDGIVVVTRQYDIESITSSARRQLGIYGLAIDQDLLHLLNSISTLALRDAIDAAFTGGEPTSLEEVAAAEIGPGQRIYLEITCVPLREHPGDEITRTMIVVHDITTHVRKRQDVERGRVQANEELERVRESMEKLSETNHKLLLANEALATAEQTQRNLNEEYLTANAQVQASTEELETYNEELQATNEEMETLIEELKATNEELSLANHDLDARSSELAVQRAASEEARAELTAILSSMPDPLVVIDRSGAVVRKNVAYDALLLTLGGEFAPRDESGHPFAADIGPQARAARGERFSLVLTVKPTDGSTRWLHVTAQPIRANHLGGNLLIMHDITEVQRQMPARSPSSSPTSS